ncbi:MAG: patatin-like phospholipase family protein [Alphaproteobacteria bacterium]
MPKTRIGLALGSGAARGWAHLGVLRALSERGIAPDVVCATSIGALAGGFYLSGLLDALESWARNLTKLGMIRYLNLRLAKNGLIAGDRLFAEMEQQLGDTAIEDLSVPFVSVATDLATGREVWLSDGRLVNAIRASFSLPAFFSPTKIDGRWLIDGALVNPVPVSVCRAFGAQVVIAVNLNANDLVPKAVSLEGIVNAPGLDPSAIWNGTGSSAAASGIGDRTLTSGRGKDEGPTLFGVVASTLNIVQNRITRSRLAAEPPEINIVPRVGHVGLLDFHRADELIEAGRIAVSQAEALLDDLTHLAGAAAS